jgi:tRNA pseudouridine38-40 synthase
VGEGDSAPERVAKVLASRDRRTNAATAPPDGLYLAAVRYPAEFALPAAADTVTRAQSAMIHRSLE